MKIIMLLDNCFDPDVRVYKEAKYLSENANDVEILCLDKKNKYKNNPKEIIDNIAIKRFFVRTEKLTNMIESKKAISKIKKVIYISWLIKFFKQIKEYLKDKGADILYCHDLVMAFGATIFFKKMPIVFDMHEYYLNNKNKVINLFLKRIVNFTQDRSKWIIYVNDKQKNDISIKNIKKVVYLPNYPNESLYLPIGKKKSDKIRVNYVGYLRDYDSLKCLMQIGIENSQIDIGLYGTGELYEKLSRENSSNNVKLYGSFNGVKESSEIYRNTDILYCVYNPKIPNWKNAYPVKLYEGIITETPIIVAKDTIISEFIEKFNIGISVEYNSFNQLNEAIKEISNNYITYQKNIREIKTNYSWENVVKNLEKIYMEGNTN